MDLSDLNENQRAAVEHKGTSLLVLAGPGSGKTKVLTTRIARLIEETPHQRFKVLGLTFTLKAATQMRERLERQLMDGIDRVYVCTFHSFCADILRQHGSHVGLKPDFTIQSQTFDQLQTIRDVIAELAHDGIDLVKIELMTLAEELEYLFRDAYEGDTDVTHSTAPNSWPKILFTTYVEHMCRNNRADFNMLLWLCQKLLTRRPRIAQLLRTIYPHICVDEFQDTNRAQYAMLRALVGDSSETLFVVADDDQILFQ